MPYIGNPIYQSAFVTDQFSGDGTTTAFTMSVAPAGTSNVLVVVSGVVQDPSTYGVVGNTLNFTAAPPSGTGNISCRYLGVPVTGVTTTAYRTVTEFTATAGQTTFTPASYNVGFINVYRNGVLLGSADYTATNGTTVVLATGATAGDLVTVESFLISSVSNAISNTAGSVSTSNIIDGGVTAAKMAAASVVLTSSAISGVLPEANGGTGTTTGYYGFKNRIINGAMGIWQRGTSGFSTASGTYTADRWKNDQTITVAQSSDVPTDTAQYSLDVTQTTPSYGTFVQNIESANCYDLVGQSVTVSFWAKNVSGALGLNVILRYATAKDNFATTTNISAVTVASSPSSSWTYYTTTFTNLPSSVANGLQLAIYRDSGTGQTRYTNIQLEKGSTATSFDYRPYGTELALCQRYYQVGDVHLFSANTSSGDGTVLFPVQMRASPTYTFSDSAGTANTYTDSGGNGQTFSINANSVNTYRFRVQAILARNATWFEFNYRVSGEL